MDWKAEAVEKLKSYQAKKLSLQITAEEIDRLTLQIEEKYRTARRLKMTSKPEEAAPLDDIAHRAELLFERDNTRRWVDMMDKALSALSDDERLILDRFYINREADSIELLCEELCLERSRVYQLKDKAVRHFSLVLYGSL